MNVTIIRLRYTQFFIICLLSVSLYTMTQSLSGGISHLEDNFWGRQFLITSFTRLRLKLGDRVFSQALVGKDGWLDYTGQKNLDGYQNTIAYPPKEMENTQQKLQKFYGELRKRNITLILVIPPNKATIYPEKLPDEIQKINAQSRLDVFTTYIHQNGPSVLLDLRPILQKARVKQDIYYKTDSHWNPYGAFFAYQEIMHELSKSYPELAPADIKNFKLTVVPSHLYNIAMIMGATNILEDRLILTPKRNSVKWATYNNNVIVPMTASISSQQHSPRLLMYMDSFGLGLKDFIAPHFSEATFIHIASQYPDLLSFKTIDTLQPNVVIVEVAERHFNIKYLDAFLNSFLSDRK